MFVLPNSLSLRERKLRNKIWIFTNRMGIFIFKFVRILVAIESASPIVVDFSGFGIWPNCPDWLCSQD